MMLALGIVIHPQNHRLPATSVDRAGWRRPMEAWAARIAHVICWSVSGRHDCTLWIFMMRCHATLVSADDVRG
jgi:hypothetical protein